AGVHRRGTTARWRECRGEACLALVGRVTRGKGMEIDLSGKAAVVTGAGRGIGLAITRALGACGARVVAADLDPVAAAEGAAEGAVVALEVDLAVAGGPERAIEAALREFGRVDVLVNNVGVCHPRDGFLSVGDEGWEELFQVNLMSAVRASRAALPPMIQAGGGS